MWYSRQTKEIVPSNDWRIWLLSTGSMMSLPRQQCYIIWLGCLEPAVYNTCSCMINFEMFDRQYLEADGAYGQYCREMQTTLVEI